MRIENNIIIDTLNYTDDDVKIVDVDMDRYCEAYNKTIDCDLCYDSMMCLTGSFTISSTPELSNIKYIEKARRICRKCIFSNI